jgi:hypothetical protein
MFFSVLFQASGKETNMNYYFLMVCENEEGKNTVKTNNNFLITERLKTFRNKKTVAM